MLAETSEVIPLIGHENRQIAHGWPYMTNVVYVFLEGPL
jgi:hypothetical protein